MGYWTLWLELYLLSAPQLLSRVQAEQEGTKPGPRLLTDYCRLIFGASLSTIGVSGCRVEQIKDDARIILGAHQEKYY